MRVAVTDGTTTIAGGAPSPSPALDARGSGHGGRRSVAVGLALVLLAVIVAVASPYSLQVVRSPSMSPTLVPGDVLVVDSSAYRSSPPTHGDLVVFDDPGGWHRMSQREGPPRGESSERYVKRVIGVGGERVTCCHPDEAIRIDGEVRHEDYLAVEVPPSRTGFDVVVRDGAVWVMGDNRDHSMDSRHLIPTPAQGFVPETDVVGRVVVVLPFGRAAP